MSNSSITRDINLTYPDWKSTDSDIAAFYMNRAILDRNLGAFELMMKYHISDSVISTRMLDILHVNNMRERALLIYDIYDRAFDEMQPAGFYYAAQSNSDNVPYLYDDIRDDLILNPTFYVGYLTPEMKVYITSDEDWPYLSRNPTINAMVDDEASDPETKTIVNNPDNTMLQLFPSPDLAIQDNVFKGISQSILNIIRQKKERPLTPQDNPILIYYLRDLWNEELKQNPPSYTL